MVRPPGTAAGRNVGGHAPCCTDIDPCRYTPGSREGRHEATGTRGRADGVQRRRTDRLRPGAGRRPATPGRPGAAPDPPRRLVGDRPEFGRFCHCDHHLRVERLHHGLLAVNADHDVARQQQPEPAVDIQRPVSQRRVAGAEDEVVLHLLAELLPQGGPDVDLGEHAEALLPQRGADALDGVGEWRLHRDRHAVVHGSSFSRPFRSFCGSAALRTGIGRASCRERV